MLTTDPPVSIEIIMVWVLNVGTCTYNVLYPTLLALLHLPRWFGC